MRKEKPKERENITPSIFKQNNISIHKNRNHVTYLEVLYIVTKFHCIHRQCTLIKNIIPS